MPQHLKDGKPPDEQMASAHLQERREARYTVPMAIEVSGSTRNGEIFHERTFTRNVRAWGCGFLLPVELRVEDIIAVRVAGRDAREPAYARVSLFQVVRVSREEEGWLVGAWKMGGENLWGDELEGIAKREEGDKGARRGRNSDSGKRPQGNKEQ